MIIDKLKLKEYINNKYHGSVYVNKIISTEICKKRYGIEQISTESCYYDDVCRDGVVILDMIKCFWSGWVIVTKETSSLSSPVGTWRLSERYRWYNLDKYNEWIVDIRDKQIEELCD